MFALVEIWLVLSLVVAWAGVAAAVVRDARSRVENPSAARLAGILAALIPVAGGLLWLCIRPGETRTDRRERRLLLAACEQDAQLSPGVAAPGPVAPARAAVRRAAA